MTLFVIDNHIFFALFWSLISDCDLTSFFQFFLEICYLSVDSIVTVSDIFRHRIRQLKKDIVVSYDSAGLRRFFQKIDCFMEIMSG